MDALTGPLWSQEQAISVHRLLNACDDGNVQQTISEFSAIVRARDEGH